MLELKLAGQSSWPDRRPEWRGSRGWALGDQHVRCRRSPSSPNSLKQRQVTDELAAIGIAAFGPLLTDPSSPDYGLMLSTTKPGWSGSNLRADIDARLDVPVLSIAT